MTTAARVTETTNIILTSLAIDTSHAYRNMILLWFMLQFFANSLPILASRLRETPSMQSAELSVF